MSIRRISQQPPFGSYPAGLGKVSGRHPAGQSRFAWVGTHSSHQASAFGGPVPCLFPSWTPYSLRCPWAWETVMFR